MPPKVAVIVIAGPVGVGKTTAISGLLDHKPSDEHWAVLVNTFKAGGIDGALLGAAVEGAGKRDGVSVRELSGGCFSCTSSAVFTPTIAQLVRRTRPRRLLIEPSGLGHPGTIVDVLTGPHLSPALEPPVTICLVDVRAVAAKDAKVLEDEVFQSTISLADVIVASKADLATEEELQAFLRWGRDLFPPKAVVATELTAALLDTAANCQPPPPLQEGDALSRGASPDAAAGDPPVPGRPRLQTSSRDGCCVADWAFSASDIFDVERLRPVLEALLCTPGVVRVRGIFRLGKEWFCLRLAPGAEAGSECIPLDTSTGMVLRSAVYRKDSRIELIIDHEQPALVIEDCGDQDESKGLAARARQAVMSVHWQSLEAVLVMCLRRA